MGNNKLCSRGKIKIKLNMQFQHSSSITTTGDGFVARSKPYINVSLCIITTQIHQKIDGIKNSGCSCFAAYIKDLIQWSMVTRPFILPRVKQLLSFKHKHSSLIINQHCRIILWISSSYCCLVWKRSQRNDTCCKTLLLSSGVALIV